MKQQSTEGISVNVKELIGLQQLARGFDFGRSKHIQSQLMGNHIAKRPGRGMDFDQVRGYQAGDDIRHMEWRVTARTGKPQVKLYQEERERSVFFIVDFNPSMFFATRVAFKSVIAAKIAAFLAWATIQHDDRVGGIVFSGDRHLQLKPRSRQQGVLSLLNALADYSNAPASSQNASLDDILHRLRQVARPGAMIFLLSDFYHLGNESKRHMSQLAKHADIFACHILDPIEITLPPPHHYAISNGVQESLMDLSHPRQRSQYKALFSAKRAEVKRLFNSLALPRLEVACDADWLALLHKALMGKCLRGNAGG